jgi:hypothetical protein
VKRSMATASMIVWTLLMFGYRIAVKLYLVIALRIVAKNPVFTR